MSKDQKATEEPSSMNKYKYEEPDWAKLEKEAATSSLLKATKEGNLNMVRYFIEKKQEKLPNDHRTILELATQGGSLEVVKYLISEAKVNPAAGEGQGETILLKAAGFASLEIIKYLVEEHKLDPLLEERYGWFPLYQAASKGNTDVVRYFVKERHCNVNKISMKNKKLRTTLIIATKNGHLSTVKCLLEECGADPNLKQKDGQGIVSFACKKGHLEILKYLVEKHKVDPQGGLFAAARKEELDIVKYLVEECKVDLLRVNGAGQTASQVARGSAWKYLDTKTEEQKAEAEQKAQQKKKKKACCNIM